LDDEVVVESSDTFSGRSPFRLKVVVSEEAVVVEPGAVVGATPQIHVQPAVVVASVVTVTILKGSIPAVDAVVPESCLFTLFMTMCLTVACGSQTGHSTSVSLQ